MRRIQLILRAALAAALLAALPAHAVPPQVMTYSGYLKTSAGAPVTSSTTIWFRLYAASSGGPTLWDQQVAVTPSSDGWFSAVLGTATPLPFAILNQDLYLSLQIGADPEFTQRARVTPAHAALTVDWSGVQGKPTCAAGGYLSLDGTGALTCTIPPTGASGITSVSGSRGITATTTGGSVSLTLPLCATSGDIMKWDGVSSTWGCAAAPASFTPPTPASCSAGQVMQWNGASWICAADATGLASVSVDAARFTGSGTAGAPIGLAGCGATAGQILQWNGATWSCIATPSGGGGGVTSVSPNLGSGLDLAPTTGAVVASLRRDCAGGQTLKWTAATGWGCADDLNSVTDVTATSPLAAVAIGTTRDISMPQAGVGQSGYLGSLDWYAFNAKLDQPGAVPCDGGSFVTWSGTAFGCAPGSGGTLTGITAGARIAVGGSPTVPSVGLSACVADGQILKYTVAGGWACEADAVNAGTVTAIGTGTGLSGGPITGSGTISIDRAVVPQLDAALNTFAGTVGAAGGFVGNLTGNASTATTASAVASGAVTPDGLSGGATALAGQVPARGATAGSFSWTTPIVPPAGACAANQKLTWNGTSASCSLDIDTNSGGTVTSVTAAAPLVVGGTAAAPQIALPTCPAGNTLRSTGTSWECVVPSVAGHANSGQVTLGASATFSYVYGASVTAPWPGVCTYVARLLVLAVPSITTYTQTVPAYRTGGFDSSSGNVTPLERDPTTGNGMASDAYMISVARGATYDLGCRIYNTTETAGRTASCKVMYHCTPS